MSSNAVILAPAMFVVGDRSDSSVLDDCYLCGRKSSQEQKAAWVMLRPTTQAAL